VTLVCSGQAIFYVARERRHLWSSRPGRWLVASSIIDLGLWAIFATQGILMAPLSVPIVAGVFGAAILLAFMLDAVKLALFQRLAIA
jgi:H+-transporting ATPase